MTPTPIIEGPDHEGGGTPNGRALVGTSPQNPPFAISPPESQVTPPLLTSISDHLSLLAPEPTDGEPVPFAWSGAPTKEGLRQLRLESYCPGFVADQAAEVLARLWEGETLLKICRSPGMPKRSVVMWWAELVPEFGAMLAKALESCGAVIRDEATELALATGDDKGDPSMVRALLAVAASYDKRIAKGAESDVNVATGITVTIQKFSND